MNQDWREENQKRARHALPSLLQPEQRTREYASDSTLLETDETQLEEDVARQRAVSSSANRVPNEILTEIFSYIPNNFQAPQLTEGPRLVCRRWNSVAITSPCLWTNVVLDDNEKREDAVPWPFLIMSDWISRSSTLSLNVVMNFTGSNVPQSKPFWEKFGGFLESIPRWATLAFTGHPLDFARIFDEHAKPRRLEELSYTPDHDSFHWAMQESYSYADARINIFDTLRRLLISASSRSHLVRFIGHNVTTLYFKRVNMDVHDYLAMSQDTPNVTFLTFAEVWWHAEEDTIELLDAEAFGHCKLVELRWNASETPSLMFQFGYHSAHNEALSVIFNHILSRGTGVHTLDITWNLEMDTPSVLQRASPQLGAVKDMCITGLFENGVEFSCWRAWITKCRLLKKLEINCEGAPGTGETDLIKSWYNDMAPGSSVLTLPGLQIDFRNSCIRVSALWGLHRACRSTIPLRDHFLDEKSEAIDWPRDKNGQLLDLSEAADTEIESKLVRFIVN